MSNATSQQADRVATMVRETLGEEVVAAPERIARGFGNENWLVQCDSRDVVAKVAPSSIDTLKLRAASRAQELAAAGGVPTARLLCFVEQCELLEDRTVRIVEFAQGLHPDDVVCDDATNERFLSSLGAAVATLHGIALDSFSSRLDGSAPQFDTWQAYVAYRLPQIARRVVDTRVFSAAEMAQLARRVEDLSRAVSPAVHPVLTHRDLYLDNLLVDPDGTLCSVLDWDCAEAWDPAVDFVKLRWQVFPDRPNTEAFWLAYEAVHGALPQLRARMQVVDVLELVNTVANAHREGWDDYEETSRQNLDSVIADLAM
jgi:aminoglycoside phosphotransferase (APT) family kinase protein